MQFIENLLRKCDEIILDLFQVVSHKIEKSVGWSNFLLARLILLIGLAIDLVFDDVFGRILYFVAVLSAFASLTIDEVSKPSVQSEAYANPRRYLPNLIRLRIFSSILVSLALILRVLGVYLLAVLDWPLICMWAYMYLSSCDILPPGMSRFRKFLKSLVPKRVIPVENHS